MMKYKKMRNKVVNMMRNFNKSKAERALDKATTAIEYEKTIKRLKNEKHQSFLPSDKNLELDGYTRWHLAKDAARYYKSRAEDLVSDENITVLGPLECNQAELLPSTFSFEKEEYDYEEITDLIPAKKISKMAGPDGVAGYHLKMFWPHIRDTVNEILNKDPFIFPHFCQGYYQRTIPKKENANTKKDLRPLGHSNPIPKYHFCKKFFSQLREHLAPIFEDKKLYGYKGTHLCMIDTFDTVREKILAGETVLHVKYDYSNAFGTFNHKRFLITASQLNLDDDALLFLADFLENQNYASTLITDDKGIYLSSFVKMLRGAAQGQIGSDICFTLQQLELITNLAARNGYCDDLNDILGDKTPDEVIRSAIENERQLQIQSEAVGYKLNAGKTEYIIWNTPIEAFENYPEIDKKYIKTDSILLGVPFVATPKGVDLAPAVDSIIKRLNYKAQSIHSCRSLTTKNEVKARVAKSLIFHCLGDLHLIRAYCPSKLFDKVRVKVNQLLRATGLERKTPQTDLNKVLGTSLEDFADQGIIVNGLKILTKNMDTDVIGQVFDRTAKLRNTQKSKTYLQAFRNKWNKLDIKDRKKILDFKNFKQVKNYLKKMRKIPFDEKIYEKYKWKDYTKM